MVESIKGKKLNKGEWAEFYVMMKLLGEGRLYTANKLLQKNYQSYLDVLKIIRQECESQVLEYIIDEPNAGVVVKPQDADIVLLLHREGIYNDSVPLNKLEVLVAKNRHGESNRIINLDFDLRTQLIKEF